MNNFAILNNKEIKQFDNNVIGFPTSLNDKFILKKELKDGTHSNYCDMMFEINDKIFVIVYSSQHRE